MDTIAEVGALLAMNVRAIVDSRDAVTVTTTPGPGGNVVFSVRVDPKDVGKLIGKQGRTARALRVILGAIAKGNGSNYSLDLDGFKMGSEEDAAGY